MLDRCILWVAYILQTPQRGTWPCNRNKGRTCQAKQLCIGPTKTGATFLVEKEGAAAATQHMLSFALEKQNVSQLYMCHWQPETTHKNLCSLSKALRMRLATEVITGVFQEGSLAASSSSGTGQSLLFAWMSFASVELHAEQSMITARMLRTKSVGWRLQHPGTTGLQQAADLCVGGNIRCAWTEHRM